MSALLAVLLLATPDSPSSVQARNRTEAYYHYSLGLQARFSGDTQQALEEYRRAQKLDPTAGEIRSEMARLLLEAGKLDEALPEAEAGVKLDPENGEARFTLARLHQLRAEAGSDEAALRRAAVEYEEVSRLRPGDVLTLRILADIYRRLQDDKHAAESLERYLDLDPKYFDGYVQLGTHYLALGDPDRASAVLQKAIDIDPTSARGYLELGQIYSGANQADQAVLHFRKALEIEPDNVRARLSLGDVLFRARRYPEALAEAEAVLQADPKNPYALDIKGRSLRETKDYAAALAVADTLLQQDPRNPKAGYLKVTIAEAKRDYALAASLLETILARNRSGEDATETAANDRVFLVHLGFAYQQLERYADAADVFGRASAKGDPDAALAGYRIEALFLAKDYDTGLAEVRAARKRFPEDTDLTTLEATLLRVSGDLPAAIAIVEALEEKRPKDVNVLLQVAEFYQRAKRYPAAETTLRSAREADPKNLRGLFQLGAVLERQKKHEEAEAVFREALVLEPDSAPVLNYLGYMNADRGVRLDESLALIERAVALDPDNGAYLDSLGWALYRLSRLEKAEDNLRRAVTRPGANAVVFEHLGDTLERRGNVQEALVFWKQALGASDDDEELDRPRVEQKVRAAEKSLGAQNQTP